MADAIAELLDRVVAAIDRNSAELRGLRADMQRHLLSDSAAKWELRRVLLDWFGDPRYRFKAAELVWDMQDYPPLAVALARCGIDVSLDERALLTAVGILLRSLPWAERVAMDGGSALYGFADL